MFSISVVADQAELNSFKTNYFGPDTNLLFLDLARFYCIWRCSGVPPFSNPSLYRTYKSSTE